MLRHDKSNDGLIQFEEFKQMLLGDNQQQDEDSGQLRMTTSKASPMNKSPRFPAGS